MSQCTNGSCRIPSSVLIQTGIRAVEERPVCASCAEALRSLFPIQRPEPGVPAWVARMDRNAKVLRAA